MDWKQQSAAAILVAFLVLCASISSSDAAVAAYALSTIVVTQCWNVIGSANPKLNYEIN
jgi:hypothetical protein